MNQEKIGEFLKKLRKDNKLTQAELAEKLGVTYQAVSKWENGKNVPDIAIIKEISKIYNVNVDEIISGEKTKKKLDKSSIIISVCFGIVLLAMLITIIVLSITKKSGFDIKEIETKCENFKVSGSIVYNKSASYIHLSPITFCGTDDEVYSSIGCTLYEKTGDTINKVSVCDEGNNVNLKDYLENIKLHVDNYKHVCDNVDNIEIYLEINATNNEEKVTTYKVPLEVSKSCVKIK